MAKIIKNPPPFNLLQSTAKDSYLKEIITKGGEAMNRSPRMPPWGSDLNQSEVDSLIIYLKSMVEVLLSGIVLGLIPVTIFGLFVTAYLQYRRGDQLNF